MSERPSERTERRRVALLTAFAVLFGLMTLLVYSDYPNEAPVVRLSDEAQAGHTLWLKHNCQTCHQLYGFGGFLGPDLTNYVQGMSRARYDRMLTEGGGRMPAFDLPTSERDQILAFLREVDTTGQGEPTPLQAERPLQGPSAFVKLATAWAEQTGEVLPEAVTEAGKLDQGRFACGVCHTPLVDRSNGAPDLSRVMERLTADDIASLIRAGKYEMPAFEDATDEEIAVLVEWLMWLSEHRSELIDVHAGLTGREVFNLGDLPWFNYR
jgi:nitric oxide reductase subunit C